MKNAALIRALSRVDWGLIGSETMKTVLNPTLPLAVRLRAGQILLDKARQPHE